PGPQPLDRVGNREPPLGFGEGVALEVLAAAGAGKRRLVREVAVDRHPSYLSTLGDLAHRGGGRPDRLVQLDRGLDDPLPGLALIKHLAPQGAGSPLHVHHNEDEWFYVTEGELSFWVGGRLIEAPAGSFVYGPRDIPHTFTVTSSEARFLLVTEPAGFEAFMRTLSEPAPSLTIPPPATEAPDFEKLAATAAEYGID